MQFDVRGVVVGGNADRLAVIAGPCVIESRDLCREVAAEAQEICSRLGVGYIFKASFDKANRTSGTGFRGLGMHEGLSVLADIRDEFGCPTLTDVHESRQVGAVSEAVDVLQIPAFLCRQTDLLVAAAESGCAVNVKKGQFLAPWDMVNVVEKVHGAGNRRLMLTERGVCFGYNSLVVDMTSLPIMAQLGCPVCMDATHAVQLPGGAGKSSGGRREMVPVIAKAAAAVGISALFLEVHPDPDKALSDAATQWPLNRLESLLQQVVAIRAAAAS
jgi:2-dehydro-3-deoxyphosphooctonate aldolase (KDO 8-P synthase)